MQNLGCKGHVIKLSSENEPIFKIRPYFSGVHPPFGHHPHAELLPVWATLLFVQRGFFLLQAVNFAFCPCPAHPWELPASTFSVTPAKLGNQRLQLVPVSALPPPGEHTPLLQPSLCAPLCELSLWFSAGLIPSAYQHLSCVRGLKHDMVFLIWPHRCWGEGNNFPFAWYLWFS